MPMRYMSTLSFSSAKLTPSPENITVATCIIATMETQMRLRRVELNTDAKRATAR